MASGLIRHIIFHLIYHIMACNVMSFVCVISYNKSRHVICTCHLSFHTMLCHVICVISYHLTYRVSWYVLTSLFSQSYSPILTRYFFPDPSSEYSFRILLPDFSSGSPFWFVSHSCFKDFVRPFLVIAEFLVFVQRVVVVMENTNPCNIPIFLFLWRGFGRSAEQMLSITRYYPPDVV